MSFAPRLSSISIVTLALVSCGGSSAPSGPEGGFVPGPADDHCSMNDAMTIQKVGVCMPDVEGGGDGGAADAGAPEPYGDPLNGSEGFDDDCKYHVMAAVTPVRLNQDATFTITVIGLEPAGPATGANPYVEVTFGDTHAANTANTTMTELGGGMYKIGPVKFDRSGEWVVRFHMFGDCSDTPEDSPHAHIAFKITVP
ncbi:MAG TPA: hypothetical protein VHJ20_13000 [Polyangia bacterium]|nr:hypothetical protein [Polyangia bacterium]